MVKVTLDNAILKRIIEIEKNSDKVKDIKVPINIEINAKLMVIQKYILIMKKQKKKKKKLLKKNHQRKKLIKKKLYVKFIKKSKIYSV